MEKSKKKGFTLIELLAVIVILGLLMAIAIPSITRYIVRSRRKTVVASIGSYITEAINEVNDQQYKFSIENTIYAIPIECISLEKGGINPFGEWLQANDAYWAYVLVQYDSENYNYKYGFTFKDSAGYGMYPTINSNIKENGSQVKTGYNDLNKPTTGLAINFISLDKWNGFELDSSTRLKVLLSRNLGDNKNTCTILKKGSNYDELEGVLNKNGTLINSGDTINQVFGKTMAKSLIEEINTHGYIDVPNDAIDIWDASIQQNESIMAWITDRDSNGLYELYLAQEGNVKVSNGKYLFSYYENVKTYNLKYLDTSSVVNMDRMFYFNSKLTTIDLSSFNTSNVIYLNHFFMGCTLLQKVDLSYFDTSKVQQMNHIFQNCTSLKYIDIRNIDYANIKALINHDSVSGVPNNAKIIVKDNDVRGWIRSNINYSLTNIVTIDEL